MQDGIIQIERVTPETEAGVQAILQLSKLMAVDTNDSRTITLAARDEAGAVVGCAAVEHYGSGGLLRSVAVHPDARGRHLGGFLVAAAEAEAAAASIRALYLLTETAESFFAKVGYEAIDRADVPEKVLESDQFAKLCPSTAVAMRRNLSN